MIEITSALDLRDYDYRMYKLSYFMSMWAGSTFFTLTDVTVGLCVSYMVSLPDASIRCSCYPNSVFLYFSPPLSVFPSFGVFSPVLPPSISCVYCFSKAS